MVAITRSLISGVLAWVCVEYTGCTIRSTFISFTYVTLFVEFVACLHFCYRSQQDETSVKCDYRSPKVEVPPGSCNAEDTTVCQPEPSASSVGYWVSNTAEGERHASFIPMVKVNVCEKIENVNDHDHNVSSESVNH